MPLSQRAEAVQERLDRLANAANLVTPRIRQIWEQALNAPLNRSSTWLHGDLHSRNVLVQNGAITGIIDWGDICVGDPATDLASAWVLFPEESSRQELWGAYGDVSEATRQRAKGWALIFGLVLLDTGLVDNPRNAAIGKKILTRLAD